ncbi:MAG: hypothetical protein EB059_02430 [Alphaproteobacteria bacterium]|nr:hypothetical protein [Alphaproteobacteria bacterium]
MSLLSMLGFNQKGNEAPDKDAHMPLVIGLFCLLAFAVLLACLSATRILPISDGWYEALIYLEAHGRRAYADLDFPLPPMTLVFYRFLDAIAHGSFALNKIIGVGMSLLNAGIVFYWLRSERSVLASLLGAVLLFVIETTFPVYLARDYHTLVTLFTIPCLWLMGRAAAMMDEKLRTSFWAAIGAGAATWMLFMTKQNVGLMLGFAFVAAWMLNSAIASMKKRQPRYTLSLLGIVASYVAGLGIGALLFFSIFHPPVPISDLISNLLSIDSKGNPIYVLTRIFHDPNNANVISTGFLFGVLALLAQQIIVFFNERVSRLQLNLHPFLRDVVVIGCFVIAMLLFWWKVLPHRGLLSSFDFFSMVAIAYYVHDLIDWLLTERFAKGGSYFRIMRLALFGALILANTMTASINMVGVGLVFIYYIAASFDWVNDLVTKMGRGWYRAMVTGVVLLLLIAVVRLEIGKLLSPYAWWGVSEPPIQGSSTPAPFPALKGLQLNAARTDLIKRTVDAIDANTGLTDPILVYPNMPIFYLLADRMPMTKTYVQWFDFAREESLIHDFMLIGEKHPKIIVELVIPEMIYRGHETLLGRTLIQKDFSTYLQCMVDTGGVMVLSSDLYSLSGVQEGTYMVQANPPMTTGQIFSLTASKSLPGNSTRLTGARLPNDDKIITVPELLSANAGVEAFSTLIVTGHPSDIEQQVNDWKKTSGLSLSLLEQNAILRVLKRADVTSKLTSQCRSVLINKLEHRKHP